MPAIIDRRMLLGATSAVAALIAAGKTRADDAADPGPAPPIAVYAGSPLVDQIALSPDGKRVAMISQDGDNKILIYFDIADQKLNGTHLGPAKIRNLLWGDNDHVIVVSSQTVALSGFAGYKHEFYIANSINLTTKKVLPLFSQEEGFYGIVMGDVNRVLVDGQYRVTASNRNLTTGNIWLYSFGLDTKAGHPVHEASDGTEGYVIAPDGRPVAYSEFEQNRKQWTLYYNIAEPGKSPHFHTIYRVNEAIDFPSLEGLGRDGQSLVIYISSGEARGNYYEITPDGVMSEPLDKSDGFGTQALFHPVTKRLAGFSHRDDWVTYDYFDPLLKKLAGALPVIMGSDYRSLIAGFAEDPRKMLIYGESAADAGSYYFSDLSNGGIQPVAVNYETLPQAWITQKQPISYRATDGLDIHGYLTLPPRKAAANLPLIVLPHGGPWARDYVDFDWQAQVLASRGYAVLQPNFRGSSGYSEEFENAGQKECGRKMQTDLSDGVRYLVSKGTVDPKRVAIFGASYGGYAALAGATLDPGVYNCAVSVAGVSNFKAFIDFLISDYVTSDAPEVLYWTRFLGDRSTYDSISPEKQAARASCPVMLIHGTDDTVVPIDQSQRMDRAMKAAGKTCDFITFKGQDHWETVGSTRIEMMQAAMDFLNKYNPPA